MNRTEADHGVFVGRGVAFQQACKKVQDWLSNQPLDTRIEHASLQLNGLNAPSLATVATAVATLPKEVAFELERYLGELPGYDTSKPYNEQPQIESALTLHSYTQMCWPARLEAERTSKSQADTLQDTTMRRAKPVGGMRSVHSAVRGWLGRSGRQLPTS